MLFDAHNHLQYDALCNDVTGVLDRARKCNVTHMMACGTGLKGDWDRLRSIAESNHDTVHISIGLHPWYVDTAPVNWKGVIESTLNAIPCGIGEVGLDNSSACKCPMDEQIRALVWQLDLAIERKLPVSLHCIGAWEELYGVLKTRHSLRFMLHSYRGAPELTKELAKNGAFFSLGPSVMGNNRKPIGPTLRQIPADRLLIETDAPDGRFPRDKDSAIGEKSEPSQLHEVCEYLSKLLGKSADDFSKQTSDNAMQYFAAAIIKK